jgi:hypothetical protein
MSDTNLEDTQTIESKYNGGESDRSSRHNPNHSPDSQCSLHGNTELLTPQNPSTSNPPEIPLFNSDPGCSSDIEQSPTHHFAQETLTLPEGGTSNIGGEVALSGLALLKRNSLRLQGFKVPEPVKQPPGTLGSFAEGVAAIEEDASSELSVDSKKSYLSKIGGGRKRRKRKKKNADAGGDDCSISSVKTKPAPGGTNLEEIRAKLEVPKFWVSRKKCFLGKCKNTSFGKCCNNRG